MTYKLLYSRTSKEQIRSLHPQIKSLVKSYVLQLKENPYEGKALERELSGFYSLRLKRFRVIYRIDHQNRTVRIYHVGHRKNIYELFSEIVARTSS
jgi:mRNA interferase RelE/StbE